MARSFTKKEFSILDTFDEEGDLIKDLDISRYPEGANHSVNSRE